MSRKTNRTRRAPYSIQPRRKRPRLRFQSGAVLFIWFITFLSCFVLYMVGQNLFGNDTDTLVIAEPGSSTESPTGSDSSADQTGTAPAPTETGDVSSTPDETKSTIVNPVPESAARSASYFSDCVFVGDSITQGLADYQLIPMKNVFAGIGMNLSKIMTEKMTTTYGKCTAAEALAQAKPKKIYIMLGSNGIAWMKQEEMISEYTTFLNAVQQAAPDASIYMLSIPPVTAGREVAVENTITNAAVDAYNSALLTLANSRNCYYVDVNTALKGNDGKLPPDDANDDGIHFKTKTYRLFLDYILKHTGQT